MKQPKRVTKKKGRVAPTPELTVAAAPQKEAKADLKDIDEKLEEIFKEA